MHDDFLSNFGSLLGDDVHDVHDHETGGDQRDDEVETQSADLTARRGARRRGDGGWEKEEKGGKDDHQHDERFGHIVRQ